MKTSSYHPVLRLISLAVLFIWATGLTGCGGVSGNTYQVEGGGYQMDFQSGGTAIVSLGGQKETCKYVEDSKSVTITCADGRPTVFTINDKGQLLAPAGSFLRGMGPLSKK